MEIGIGRGHTEYMQMVVTTRIWRDYRTFSRGWDQPLEGSIFT